MAPHASVSERSALQHIRSIGVDALLDDSIKPRASADGRIASKKTRVDEPDTRILALHEWPNNILMSMDRLARRCPDDPERVRALLLRLVRRRQGDVLTRPRIRFVREVHALDIQAAIEELAAEEKGDGGGGEKRRQRTVLSFDEPADEVERQQPPAKRLRRIHGEHLVPGDDEDQRASASSSSSSSSSSAERPAMDAAQRLNLVHAPSYESLAAFERDSHKCYWVVELLVKDLDRLDEIKRMIGPRKRQEDGDGDESVASEFAGHLIASARLSDATRDMAGARADEFLEHYRLRVEDERTHLLHQRAVVEASARKLYQFIRDNPPLYLNAGLEERVDDLLY